MANILVTGGAGFIGSHTCVELIKAGHKIVVLDNFVNSDVESLTRVKTICVTDFPVEKGDVLDTGFVRSLLKKHKIESVIHFAGLKAVGESVEQPLAYYNNNVVGTYSLLSAMNDAGVHKIVFSSSATVYGDPQVLPLTESHPLSATNPYGRSKLIVEDMLRDLYKSDNQWQISILRYFNPCGAHQSGLIGEDPKGIPNNLVPFVAQVASGRREKLNIWGNDYDTPDGTGVRDYIHVVDLAEGHVKALESLSVGSGCVAVNLGTGKGYSVKEVATAFGNAAGTAIPYIIANRRPGDIASCYADCSFAKEYLNWSAKRNLVDMMTDHWRWQQNNPDGYSDCTN
ncbi:MAG: UDP-glucose 4-epimerase GalE [Hyphomonadaceae bacterium]|nr:UDP-glucose 4-epimerase GalE [Hyphomonadaceae bacterium]